MPEFAAVAEGRDWISCVEDENGGSRVEGVEFLGAEQRNVLISDIDQDVNGGPSEILSFHHPEQQAMGGGGRAITGHTG